MTVRELIIEVQQQVQRKGSYKRDPTAEQIIIWRLNTAQNRLIKSWLKPDPNNPHKFQIDQKANSDVQKLINVNVPLTTIIDTDNRVYANLPNDFLYLINDKSRVLEDCKDGFEDAKDKTVYPRTVTAFKFIDSANIEPNYYKTIVLEVLEGDTDGLLSLYDLSVNGLPSVKEKFELVDYIIKQAKALGYNLYWEQFDTCYKPDSFIYVPELGNSTPDTLTIRIDGVELPSTPVALKAYTIYKTDLDTSLMSLPVNRGYKNDFIYDAMQGNYYDQPQPDSPVSQLANGRIYVHTNKRFIVSTILMDYIRKPRRISLYLNNTCELDESVHEEVCSIAAEIILGNIEAPNYPLKVQENINRLEKT